MDSTEKFNARALKVNPLLWKIPGKVLAGHRDVRPLILRRAKVVSKEKIDVADDLHLRIHPGLRELVAKEADAENLPMSEWVAKVLAAHFKRPDLGYVPRKKMGRPRKELAAS